MAQLIDTTYFVGEISLPASSLTGTLADINPYIIKFEREALIEILGYTLYKELKAEIDSSYTAKWEGFVEGAEYTVSFAGEDNTVKWNGLINSDKVSLLAYYIFYQYMKFHNTHTSSTGEMFSNLENGVRVQPAERMVNAYNRFIDLRGKVSDQDIAPTAYNYLDENQDTLDYNPWIFLDLRHTNTFGI